MATGGGFWVAARASDYLTENYGFITDYLAEAFHYQLKHSNRYEEVSARLRPGKTIEGRDEKGIKKTLCAFLKILHPAGDISHEEFEEYVAYALEARRRIKEQMNKRKPDDEFANINLSYFDTEGKEVTVYCPESRDIDATQRPTRKALVLKGENREVSTERREQTKMDDHGTDPQTLEPAVETPEEAPRLRAEEPVPENEPQEKHFTIFYGDTGHDYESIMGPYLKGAKEVTVEDAYIRLTHQIQNFVRFCETIVRVPTIRKISLVTSYDDKTNVSEMRDNLDAVKQSLLEIDVFLDIKLNPNLHDREIRLDNGWVIKIGRGLDFYQKPGNWFEIGVNDLSLRKCLETKVDIYRG